MKSGLIAIPDLGSRKFKADPFALYARLRESSPICRVTLPNGRSAWLVARYDDCLAVLKDHARFVKDPLNVKSSGPPRPPVWVPGILKPLARNMLDLDDTDHSRLRRVVHKAFTPKLIEMLRGRVQSITDRLLNRATTRDEFDLIRDFALPLPVTVISEMLGVDEGDRERFHRWSSVVVAADTSRWHALRAVPAALGFLRFARRLTRRRRTSALRRPSDHGH